MKSKQISYQITFLTLMGLLTPACFFVQQRFASELRNCKRDTAVGKVEEAPSSNIRQTPVAQSKWVARRTNN